MTLLEMSWREEPCRFFTLSHTHPEHRLVGLAVAVGAKSHLPCQGNKKKDSNAPVEPAEDGGGPSHRKVLPCFFFCVLGNDGRQQSSALFAHSMVCTGRCSDGPGFNPWTGVGKAAAFHRFTGMNLRFCDANLRSAPKPSVFTGFHSFRLCQNLGTPKLWFSLELCP